MGVADTSQTERIRILKARALAAARRAAVMAGQYAFEQGPGGQTFPESVYLVRRLGQRSYIRMNAGETSTTTLEPCCPAEQSPPIA